MLAEESLRLMLRVGDLSGKRFLDAGSGSGLFSLAARRLGASVHSFDYDPQSVFCTEELKRLYFSDDPDWHVEVGSVLDSRYLSQLGQFDVVYSWGVLHHTGNLRKALENVAQAVAPGGLLFISLYNDQGGVSTYWSAVKRQYNRHPMARPLLKLLHAPYLLGVRCAVRALTGRLREQRGMSLWYDMVDWLGGWPFEVSRPDDIVNFYTARGFTTRELRTVGRRQGCNEFVFFRPSSH
jgi:2-polyprenyl-6-hydroxyphenyl methylase/3-demethylubiquinone-9 3-methyltransferase